MHKMWALLFLRDRKSCHKTLEEEISHMLCVIDPLLTESMEEISETVGFLLQVTDNPIPGLNYIGTNMMCFRKKLEPLRNTYYTGFQVLVKQKTGISPFSN